MKHLPKLLLSFIVIMMIGFLTSTTTYISDGVRYDSVGLVPNDAAKVEAEIGLFFGLVPVDKY